MAAAVLLAAHGHEGVHGVLLEHLVLHLFLLSDHLLELVQGDRTVLTWRCLFDHVINCLLGLRLPHHLEHAPQLGRIDVSAPVLVEDLERQVALDVLLGGEPILVQLVVQVSARHFISISPSYSIICNILQSA